MCMYMQADMRECMEHESMLRCTCTRVHMYTCTCVLVFSTAFRVREGRLVLTHTALFVMDLAPIIHRCKHLFWFMDDEIGTLERIINF